jgi:hypothetical protein
MPHKLRTDKHRPQVNDTLWDILTDRPLEKPAGKYFCSDGQKREAWDALRDEILEAWVQEYPGTRPSHWWRYDAPRMPIGTWPGCYWDGKLPEPRLRLGGVGTPAHEVLAFVPAFPFGVPDRWVDAWMVDYYNGRAVDVHGSPIGTQYHEDHFSGVAIDPDDPPTLESQAAYLERHGMFLPGEPKRLTDDDFEPESVMPAPDLELDRNGRLVE